MTEFGAVATLEITEVNGADAAFEDQVTVPMRSSGGRRPSQQTRTSGVGGMGGQSLTAMAEDRNEILAEILDVLEDSGGPGGGGGGVAGAGLGARGLGVSGGILGMVGAGIGASRQGLGQGLFGDEGRETISRRKEFEGLEGFKNALDNPGQALANGFINSIDPTGIGETAARKFGGAAESEIRDVVPQQFVTEFDETVGTLDSTLSDPPDPFKAGWPDVPDLSAEADWPELPSLSNELDWPELPDLFGDQSRGPSGSGQTPAMQLDGSQPTTSTSTSSGTGLQALDINVDGEIDVDDARAAEEKVREYVSQELQRQLRQP